MAWRAYRLRLKRIHIVEILGEVIVVTVGEQDNLGNAVCGCGMDNARFGADDAISHIGKEHGRAKRPFAGFVDCAFVAPTFE